MALPIWISLLILHCGPASQESATIGDLSTINQEPPPARMAAAAILHPTKGHTTEGIVSFEEMDGRIHIMAHIIGLAPGSYSIHIHEKGDCTSGDGQSAGEIFNPDRPATTETAAGNLGQIKADDSGMVHLEIDVDRIALTEGPTSVVGRSVIVHSGPGVAASLLACGVIEPQAADAVREGSGM